MVMVMKRMVGSRDLDWRNDAACRDSHPDLFFPIGTTGDALEEVDAAKAVCVGCSVRKECLAFAIETNQETGVWGGMSEDERRKLRRDWMAHQRRALASR